MHSKQITSTENQLKIINGLCTALDAIISPSGEIVIHHSIKLGTICLNLLLLANGDLSMLGSTEWKALQKLRTMLLQYHDKKEFSATQDWLACTEYTKIVNTLLKDAVKNFTETTKNAE